MAMLFQSKYREALFGLAAILFVLFVLFTVKFEHEMTLSYAECTGIAQEELATIVCRSNSSTNAGQVAIARNMHVFEVEFDLSQAIVTVEVSLLAKI